MSDIEMLREISNLRRQLRDFTSGQYTGTWTAYTPTVAAASGAFTTVTASGRYTQVGKTVHFKALVTITDAGTAAIYTTITLPVTPYATYREAVAGMSMVTATGAMYSDLVCFIGASNLLRIYDGAAGNPAVNGNSLIITGTYEAA